MVRVVIKRFSVGQAVSYMRYVEGKRGAAEKEAVTGLLRDLSDNGTAVVSVRGLGSVFLSQKDLFVAKLQPSVSAVAESQNPERNIHMAIKIKAPVVVAPAAKAAKVSAVAAKPAAKPAKAPKAPKESGPTRNIGVTSGLRVGEFYAQVFTQNEKNKKKWTDAEISAIMREEFPLVTGKEYDADKIWTGRRFYNRGGFKKYTGGVPKVLSKEYNAQGQAVEHKRRERSPSAQKPAPKAAVKASPKSPVVEKGRFQIKPKSKLAQAAAEG